MDFDTERDPDREEESAEGGGQAPRSVSGGRATAEFTYTDPVQSFVASVRNLVTRPADFYAGIVRQGDFINPLIFALICAAVAAVIGAILRIFGAMVGLGDTGVGGAIGGLFVAVFFTLIFVAIGLFVWAGILHLLVMLIIKPAGTGYEATFRAVSYANVGQLVGWIPFLGPLVAGIAWIVLAIIGVREVHGATTGKAALVVLIPAAVVFLIALTLILLVGAALFLTAR